MWPPTFLGVHSSCKRGRRRRCWMQGGGTVDGGGGRVWHAVEKKRQTKSHGHGARRRATSTVPLPDTVHTRSRDMGEALLLLHREGYRPSVSMLYRGCGAARYLKAIIIPSPSRLGMLSHFVGTETR